MQINIKNNIKEFSKKVSLLQKDLLPGASSRAINQTLQQLKGKQKLLQNKYLDRPKRTTQSGYFINFASKKTQTGSLNMKDFVSDYLRFQVEGGMRVSKGKNPVPVEGNAKLDRFGNIVGRRAGKRNFLIRNKKQFIAKIKGIDAVWERVSRNRVKPIIYLTSNTATYKKNNFPFYDEAYKYAKKHYKKNLRVTFARAKKKAGV
jgi:hypothetical protein